MKFINDAIIITWSMTSVCNYRCSYCPSILHDGAYKFPTETQKIINFLDNIQKQNKGKKIHLDILGGEPLLWPKLEEFLHLLDKNVYIEILSNGSRDIKWWIKNEKLLGKIYNLVLTFHPEYANADKFVEVCQFLANNFETLSQVKIMVPPGTGFKYSLLMYERLKQINNLTVAAKAIREDFGDKYLSEYSEDELKVIEASKKDSEKPKKEIIKFDTDSFYELSFNKKNSWKNQLCYIGVDRFFIEPDGTIFRATCKVGGSIGNLDSYILPSTGVICNKNLCSCITDAVIKKEKVNVYES